MLQPKPRVHRLSRFGLTTQHADSLVRFFRQAFDCREIARAQWAGAAFETLMDVRGGALGVTVALGDATIEFLEFEHPGRPYPPNLSPYDAEFQHFAIVVNDMDAAFQRLSAVPGWTAISTGGPRRLPAASGGVTAFKFRDPEGHPLELLSFPDGRTPPPWRGHPDKTVFLGIDHSAVSCARKTASIEFYETLGLAVSAQSFNQGPEQESLDGISAPELDVVAMAPVSPSPHVELLCYRTRSTGRAQSIQSNDIPATRLIFESDHTLAPITVPAETRLMDPDGHHLLVRTPHQSK